ncbi:hypothetical protein AAFF_G00105280 [Aldrovandia affinis]|uniref:Uncharacterized protein n=1 Tax=Aldrovandia affinis TaxID=143900 RepID=A0AAD7WX79_9TELE|nr:hypothetical protein AAFF_G00105280 [Aldrovandia affinis]
MPSPLQPGSAAAQLRQGRAVGASLSGRAERLQTRLTRMGDSVPIGLQSSQNALLLKQNSRLTTGRARVSRPQCPRAPRLTELAAVTENGREEALYTGIERFRIARC